jgi:micrococcal nuclease
MQEISRKNILIFSGIIIVIALFSFSSDGPQPQNIQPAVAVKTQTQTVEQEVVTKEREVVVKESVPQDSQSAVVIKTVREEQKEIEQATETFYDVVKVVDGDTLSININGKTQTLRLIGIDTPETVHPSKPVECFGIEASNKAKEVLNYQSVRIEKDATQGDYDKYNRLLAYVFLKDGTNFNQMMIKEGYAYEYTYSSVYKYQSEFKQAEGQAKTFKKGLWADGACQEEVAQVQTVSTPEPNVEITTIPTENSCSSNVYNCGDFTTHAQAQATYEYCGGVDNDIHRLDKDKDGQACESLP